MKKDATMGPKQDSVGDSPSDAQMLQQSENQSLRLSAVMQQPLSVTIADSAGRAPVSMQIVDAVRAAQAAAQAITVTGSDKSPGLPHPQVKRQAAGE